MKKTREPKATVKRKKTAKAKAKRGKSPRAAKGRRTSRGKPARRGVRGKKRALAAKKAWETRRRNARAKERQRRKRSAAAKKAWATRRRVRREIERQRAPRAPEPEGRRGRPSELPAGVEPRRRKERAPTVKRKEKSDPEVALDYFRLVLHSTCGRLRDEDVVCQVRAHREGDGSVSAEIVVPVFARAPSDVRRLVITIEELDGWSQIPGPILGKAWVSIIFRVDAASVREEDTRYRISATRGTYNVATNYHHLENAAYAFQIARDDILTGLTSVDRVVVAIIMRVRYMPDGEHPSRPRR